MMAVYANDLRTSKEKSDFVKNNGLSAFTNLPRFRPLQESDVANLFLDEMADFEQADFLVLHGKANFDLIRKHNWG